MSREAFLATGAFMLAAIGGLMLADRKGVQAWWLFSDRDDELTGQHGIPVFGLILLIAGLALGAYLTFDLIQE